MAPDDLVPNKLVDGTKISTGIFYTLQHKDTSSPVTFVPKKDGKTGDNNLVTRDWKEYQPGGKWRESTLFSLSPESDHYILFHKQTSSPVTFMPKEDGKTGDNNLVIRDWKEYQPGGKWRDSLYFSLSSESDGCVLFHKQTSSLVAYVPKKDGKIEENDLVTRDWKEYQPGGQWRNSVYFSFIPQAGYKLKASIENFKYDPIVHNLGSLAKNVSAHEHTHVNRSENSDQCQHEIKRKEVNTSSWSFSQSQETTFLNELEVGISAEYCGVKGNVQNTTTWGNKTTSLVDTKKENVDETEVNMTYNFSVRPQTKVELVITWEKVEADIPFTATVRLTGFADRLKKDGTVSNMAQLDADGVIALLHHAGYKGKIISTEGNDVIAEITGSVHVSGATKGTVEKREYPL